MQTKISFKQIILIAAIGLGIISFGRSFKAQREQDKVVTAAVATGGAALAKAGVPKTCERKKVCITVFVAPWCGVCNQCIPSFRALNKFLPQIRPDIGFGLVIGGGEGDQNQKKREELSDIEAMIDSTGDIMDKRKIQAYPTWVITDARGKEISRKAAGITFGDEAGVRQFVKQEIDN